MPENWGTKSRGKLSADQWRVLCTLYLPITLIGLWSQGDKRKKDMLNNFMRLVVAVRIASMRSTSKRLIEIYEVSMWMYLKTMKELYPHAVVKPNHHMALHLGDFLESLGPVHAYRSFAFERFNYVLQKLHTNMKFGESNVAHVQFLTLKTNFISRGTRINVHESSVSRV